MASHFNDRLSALGPRDAILQAVDILMDEHGMTKIDALEMLVQGSLLTRVTVHERAVCIVDEERQVI